MALRFLIVVSAILCTARVLAAAPPLLLPAHETGEASRLSVTPDGRVLLSWVEAAGEGHRLRFAFYDDRVWSDARTVAEGRNWFVNWADFPSVVAGQGGRMAAHWLAKNGEQTYAYEVRFSLSSDHGATWSAPRTLHDDTTTAEHGFVSLLSASGGSFFAVWLDGRNTLPPGNGPMTLRHATIESSGEVVARGVIDERVCDCCNTAATRSAGATVVAYRDRTLGEIRDIVAGRLDAGRWQPAAEVPRDQWYVPGCPVNGPALAARAQVVALAWFSAANNTPRVFLSMSTDGGRRFGPRVQMDDGDPIGRVDVAMLPSGDAAVLWLERQGKGAVLRVGRPGRPALDVAAVDPSHKSGFPRMVRSGSNLYFVWTVPGKLPSLRGAYLPVNALH